VTCNPGYILTGTVTSCSAGNLTSTQTCAAPVSTPPPSDTDGPIPLWAFLLLAAALLAVASRGWQKTR
jgi:hypothetical protein